MTTCIFCKIINKEIPSDILYENDFVLAFLDIKPVNRGHVLVVPKQHSNDLLDANEEVLKDLLPKVKKIASAIMRAVGAQGINISINNGAAAGQVVFHLHFHLIPRFTYDNLKPWPHHDSEPNTRVELADAIKKNL